MKICFPLKLHCGFINRTRFVLATVLAIIYSYLSPYEILGDVDTIILCISTPEYPVLNTIKYNSEMNARIHRLSKRSKFSQYHKRTNLINVLKMRGKC